MNTSNIPASSRWRRAAVVATLVLTGSLLAATPAAAAIAATSAPALVAGSSAGGDWLPPCKPPYDEEWCHR